MNSYVPILLRKVLNIFKSRNFEFNLLHQNDNYDLKQENRCVHVFCCYSWLIFCFFFRVEIETLRADQCNNCANGNRLKNEELTVQWLANSITEIRSEISELAQSFNSTIELQQQQALSTDISIIQNDIVSLRHDLESFKGEFVKAGAKLATMSQDIDISRQLSHSTAAVATNLTEKVSYS